MWEFIKKVQKGSKFRTKCGFKVIIYSASHDNVLSGIHGAILIPNHPATFPGWLINEWSGDTGKSLNKNEHWDLQEDLNE